MKRSLLLSQESRVGYNKVWSRAESVADIDDNCNSMLSHALSKASCLLAMLPCPEFDQVFGHKSCEASRHGNALLIMFSDILYMFPPPHTSGNYLSGAVEKSVAACFFQLAPILHVTSPFLPPSIHYTVLEPQVL